MKVTDPLPGEVWTVCEKVEKKTYKQPIQQCMAERPEVSRGRSTVKGNDPVVRGG